MSFQIRGNILYKYIHDDNISDIVIPYGIREISMFCFSHNDNITSIRIPDTVRRIQKMAISNCHNLKKIEMTSSVVIIDSYAFADCISLEYFYIPESVKFIGENIFKGCMGLQKIEISKKNPNYIIDDNVLFNRDMTEIFSYLPFKSEKRYNIPNTVTKINASTFESCSNLREIIMTDSVEIIGSLCFCDCFNLEHIRLSNSLKNNGRMLFMECKNLSVISMPLFFSADDNDTFTNCRNIRELEIFCDKFNLDLKSSSHFTLSEIRNILEFCNSSNPEEAFKKIKKSEYKIQIALCMINNYDFLKVYVRKNIKKTVKYLIDRNDIDLIQKILPFGFITEKNIDEFTEYALNNKNNDFYDWFLNLSLSY